ncbi:ATP-grasp domain-containing protein [Micromonospora polyrhachis]|uniref:Biotin carboxylase n=1 Tax=Micromonospora polyrhachis TaxID=1282883 RepID=A0A7W7SLK1_9ACTN|nr:ATP-grasp domain-containing protein [Micromonospora polyrhachis]MBB4956886.1 biotin carboxylase [Micromonospora polyrhachis]
MTKRIVALAEPFSSASLIPPMLREAGFAPVALLDSTLPGIGVLTAFDSDRYDAVIDHRGDVDVAIERLRTLGETVAVIPGTDRVEGLCGRIAQVLTPHQVNVPELAAARRNKYLSHQAVAAAGLPVLRQICTADADEVEQWIEREGLTGRDLVVKPATSAGTDGVGFAQGGKGWRELHAELLGTTNRYGAINEQVLVQEYVTGTEFAIDTVSFDGHHSVTDLGCYLKVHNERGMAIYDNVEWLPYDTDAYGEVLDYTLGALDAVGFRYWAAHTEVMLTEDGPRLIEINPRPAGAMKPLVSEIAAGSSQLSRIIDICTGRGASLPDGFDLRQPVMALFLIANASGVVKNAEIFDKARSLPSYHSPVFLVKTGDRVEATTDLVSSMSMGYIILAHESREQVYADREAIRELERELVIEPE